ncbi:shikimate O-hydroxycinnamoyltransferase-like [Bidens hawaiensis]|uniref:shikimate O-hydroxycinnamoyltransferase-like n=1 Tax=Bidens hawaiensis TaxID=980011 RepID=UPI00404A16D2
MVKPSKVTPTINLYNSSLDLTAPNMPPPVLYFYRPNGAHNFFDSNLMKDGLSRVLVAFYPVAGRFKQGEDGRIEIDCQGQGALFVEAECDLVLDDFGDFAPRVEFVKLVPMVDYSKGGGDSYPLYYMLGIGYTGGLFVKKYSLGIPVSKFTGQSGKVTYFKCGGVSLGVGLRHRVDGRDFRHALNKHMV